MRVRAVVNPLVVQLVFYIRIIIVGERATETDSRIQCIIGRDAHIVADATATATRRDAASTSSKSLSLGLLHMGTQHSSHGHSSPPLYSINPLVRRHKFAPGAPTLLTTPTRATGLSALVFRLVWRR